MRGFLAYGARLVTLIVGATLLAACSAEQDAATDTETTPKPAQNPVSSVDTARIAAADSEPGNWFTTGRTFGETRFSPLTQINRETVSRLGFAWEYDTATTRGLEASPVVVDGWMYTSGTWGKVYALNAATGEELWRFDPKVDGQFGHDACCDVVNRGVAVWKGKVYVAALDGRLIALDALTGAVAWQVDTITEHERRYTITGAPRIAGDVVVIGNSGAEFDARGYISAYDTATGDLKWRFYTVPGDPANPPEHPEMVEALKTWDPNSRWDVGGGGTVWDSLVYDPELNILYVGTGNSAPYAIEVRSPSGGDNLYLSSILAINPDTGRLVWHYQTTPGDSWDFTATMNMILTDLEIDGATRKVLMQAPKNGFFYVLDRETGELLSANNYVPVTWATHVDMETGRPVMTENARYFSEPKVQSPTDAGGHGWQPMAYSPDTGLVYIPAWELYWLRLNLMPPDKVDGGYTYLKGEINMGVLNFPAQPAVVDAYAPILPYDADYLKAIIAAADAPPDTEFLRAWDPVKGEVAWQIEGIEFGDGGGVLATAGGLVFQGHASGLMTVHDAATGEVLRTIDTGTGMMAAPMTYAVDGEQYVAVMAGLGGAGFWAFPKFTAAYSRGNAGRIIVFRLDGGAVPMPAEIPVEPFPAPPESNASAEQLARGEVLTLKNCGICHASSGPGLLPDLRRLTLEKHAAFDDILLGGLLRANGMPDFSELLDNEDAADIHAWLIELQGQAYAAEQDESR